MAAAAAATEVHSPPAGAANAGAAPALTDTGAQEPCLKFARALCWQLFAAESSHARRAP